MKKILIFVLLSTIGFSQNCENPILDQILESNDVNQYFKIALLSNISNLEYLNSCDGSEYTMFVPGNNVPTESALMLTSLGGSLMDYIPYYIHSGSIIFSELTSEEEIEMMDGNIANITVSQYNAMINDVNINDQDICACNGLIHIIDDLIWAPGVVSLNNNHNQLEIYPNPIKNILNISKVHNYNLIEIFDIHNQLIVSQKINSINRINMTKYKSGIYILKLKSNKEVLKTTLIKL